MGANRFLLVRYGGIGNALVSVPAVRALRRAFPASYIAMLVGKQGLDILHGCPYINEFILYDKDGEHRGMVKFIRIIRELRARDIDTSIHFKRFRRSETLGFLAGARERVGFETQGKRTYFLTRTVPYVEGKNIVDLNLDLVRALGISSGDLSLELWPSPEDSARVDAFIGKHGLHGKGPLVAMHAGGKTLRDSLWGEENFMALADILHSRYGARFLLLGGPDEAALKERIAQKIPTAAVPVEGLTIRGTAELIRRCALFIGTDSGPSHLADAVGTPGVIIFDDSPGYVTQVAKWKPLGPKYVPLSTASSPEDVSSAVSMLLS